MDRFIFELRKRGLSLRGLSELTDVPLRVIHSLIISAGLSPDRRYTSLVVHHIDGNRSNNCSQNLRILSNYDHAQLHNLQGDSEHESLRKVCPEGQAWCSGCQACLPRDEFYKDASHWNGLAKRCKECWKFHSKIYRAAHKNTAKAYYLAHRERFLEYKKKWNRSRKEEAIKNA